MPQAAGPVAVLKDPARHQAPDGLHPWSDGHGLWCERLEASGSLA